MTNKFNYDPWRESPPVGFLDMVETELAKMREAQPESLVERDRFHGRLSEEFSEVKASLMYATNPERQQEHQKQARLTALVRMAAICYCVAEDLNLLDSNTA